MPPDQGHPLGIQISMSSARHFCHEKTRLNPSFGAPAAASTSGDPHQPACLRGRLGHQDSRFQAARWHSGRTKGDPVVPDLPTLPGPFPGPHRAARPAPAPHGLLLGPSSLSGHTQPFRLQSQESPRPLHVAGRCWALGLCTCHSLRLQSPSFAPCSVDLLFLQEVPGLCLEHLASDHVLLSQPWAFSWWAAKPTRQGTLSYCCAPPAHSRHPMHELKREPDSGEKPAGPT